MLGKKETSGKLRSNIPQYLAAKLPTGNFQKESNQLSEKYQMHSQSLTPWNTALKHWHELTGDPWIQSYVQYPATLKIKIAGERKYRVEKEY